MPDNILTRYSPIPAGATNRDSIIYDHNFLGISTTDLGGLSFLDVSANGAPTFPAVSGEGGWFAWLMAANVEAHEAGIYNGDALCLSLEEGLTMECKVRWTALPLAVTTNTCIGLASAHNADEDAITRNIWFKLEALAGTLVVETDDGVDTDDIDTGIVIAVNTSYYFKIVCIPTAVAGTFMIEFYVGAGDDADYVRVGATTAAFDAYAGGAGALYQPYIITRKTDAEQPRLEIDWGRIYTPRA